MSRLTVMDAAFLRMESPHTPMHVGGLMTFKLPKGAPRDWLLRLADNLRNHPFLPPPFDCRVHWPNSHLALPWWEPARTDIDYHIRHSALPWPGGEKELGVLVSRLHSNPMDLERPPWEYHIIEGLERRRFALYFKAHHCAIDGVRAMRMVKQWLSTDPEEQRGPGELLALDRERQDREKPGTPAEDIAHQRALESLLSNAGGGVRNARDMVNTFYRLGQGGEDSVLRAALRTPRTPFNVAVTPQRRLGTQLLPLRRFKRIAERSGATINDICLSLCGAAARRYLLEAGALPKSPLTASVPIGLPRNDGKPGNAVSGFVCPLGTHIADPAERLARIHATTRRTKEQMLAASSVTLERFGAFGIAPLMLGQLTGTLPRLPPLFNVIVSNVVASKEPLYLLGARLEAMYPMSILFDGYALNMTVIGYADDVAIGFTGCRKAVPSLQRLAVYTGEALAELEDAISAKRGSARSSRPARR